MGILSTAAANAAKRAIETALPDLAAVIRPARMVDPLTGGWTEIEVAYASGVPCRVDKSGLTSRERAIAEARGSVQTFNLLLSAHPSRWPGSIPSIGAGDRIVVTGEGAGTFEPAESSGPVTDQLAVEIVCTRVTQ